MAYIDEVLADSPWAYLPFTETSGTTLADASPAAHGFTINGSPTFNVSGPFGTKGISWPGTDYTGAVYASSAANMVFTNVTLEAWVYLDALPSTDVNVIGSGTAWNSTGDVSLLVQSTGIVRAWRYNPTGTDRSAFSATALTVGAWHHVVATYSTTTGVKIRINKVDAGSTSLTSSQSSDSKMWIKAAGLHAGGAFQANPAIRIAHPAMYTSILSDARIDAHYNALATSYTGAVMADSPLLYWRLGETSGTTVTDSSGNGHDATYNTAPTLGVTGLLPGDSDKAVTLSGAQYAQVSQAAWMSSLTGAIAVEAWIKPTTVSGEHIILARANFDDTFGSTWSWYLMQRNDTVQWGTFTGGNWSELGSGSALTAGAVHHVVGVYDPVTTTMRIYVNGVEKGQRSKSGSLNDSPIGISLAADWNGNVSRFVGTLDEVAVYGTALSATRVQAHYAAGLGSTSVTASDTATASGTVSDDPWDPAAPYNPGAPWVNQAGVLVNQPVNQPVTAVDTVPAAGLIGGAAATDTAVGTNAVSSVGLTADQAVSTVETGIVASTAYSATVVSGGSALYWRLGETSGPAVDLTGHGRDGVYTNAPTLGVTGLLTGDADAAVQMDGTDDKVLYSGSVLNGSGAFSCEFFIATSMVPSSLVWMADLHSSSTRQIFYLQADGRLFVDLQTSTGTGSLLGPVINDGARHHIVVAWSVGKKATLYVDGVQQAQTASTLGGSVSLTTVSLGNHGFTNTPSVAGVYDEFAIYPTELTKNQSAMHHAIGTGASTIPVETADAAVAADSANSDLFLSYTPATVGPNPNGLVATDAGFGTAILRWNPAGSYNFENGMPPGITHSTTGAATIVADTDSATGTTRALQPADLDDGTEAWSEFILRTTSSGTLTFRYHVESESCCDYGVVEVDGYTVLDQGGILPWSAVTSPTLSPGNHVVRVSYFKDGSVSSGFDNVRIGQISSSITVSDYQYRVDGGAPVSLGSSGTSTSITGLSAGSHTFEIRAITSVGTSAWSNLATTNVSSGTPTVVATIALSSTGTLTAVGTSYQALAPYEAHVELPGGSVDAGTIVDPGAEFNDYPSTGYRYFTFDIMTDQLLAEIPLSDVNFSVKLGEVGELSGTLPVGQLDYDIDAYGATMPMRTALYVLRGKKAVWGGIIWARDYDANSQTLQLSCGTWESYLFRRYMWIYEYTADGDIDQFEVVRQMLFKMRHDFEFDYDSTYDYVIPQPQASAVDIFVDTSDMAGQTQDTQTFKGSDMKSFGEWLTEYANNLKGFEWYFDISFNEHALRFRRRLTLLPTPPSLLPKGSDDPPSDEEHRPGIDTYLFEYPGNIASLSLSEDGDNACTRQFVVGGSRGGGAKAYGSWNNVEYLEAGYPLIENVEASKHSSSTKLVRLNNLATVYGRDSAPPVRNWNIVVNGSMDPVVGSYRVGNWCRLVVHDPYVQRSLMSSADFDPLGGVVKRIVGYSVAVPNGPQTPELVTLELEDDPTVSFDLTHQEAQGSLNDDRGPFYYGTYMPDATTTGVAVEVFPLTNYNAPSVNALTIPAGTVIEDKIIHGDITVSGSGDSPVILRRCRLVGGGNVPGSIRGVVNVDAAPGQIALRMFDCEITPRVPSKHRDGIIGRSFDAIRVYMDNVVQGIVIEPGTRPSGDLTVRVLGCWVRSLLRVDNRPARCLVHKGGGNVEVKGNRFSGVAKLNSDDPGDFTGSTSDYLVAQELGDSVVYLDNVSGTDGFGSTVKYQKNFLYGGTSQLRVRASVGAVEYSENKHFRYVADDASEGYPGTWIWIESRSTNIIGLGTNVWRDGPYVGSPLAEPQDVGILYDGA